ncbi:MAG TPA: ankyrin repeat domain-containing protein [Methylophilus sp.]|jgi:ankyrin repeat protein|nr:ankyrin repeat domain-containing protein [Methylophilus sp.]HQQ33970.1 ankyrin repeat domain-containing protein [Methylophilus sp.]
MKFFKAVLFAFTLLFAITSQAGTLNDDEYMELSGALTDGKLDVVKRYIDKDPSLLSYTFYAWQPLQMATNHNQVAVVKYLVEKGADKNYVHPVSKMTAFHLAAFNGSDEIVKYLAAQGADINIKMKGGVSLIRVVKDEGNTKMVELLTSLGVKEEGCEGECF